MKVRELIAALQEHDPDEPVFAYRDDCAWFGFVVLDRVTKCTHYRSKPTECGQPSLIIRGLFVEKCPDLKGGFVAKEPAS